MEPNQLNSSAVLQTTVFNQATYAPDFDTSFHPSDQNCVSRRAPPPLDLPPPCTKFVSNETENVTADRAFGRVDAHSRRGVVSRFTPACVGQKPSDPPLWFLKPSSQKLKCRPINIDVTSPIDSHSAEAELLETENPGLHSYAYALAEAFRSAATGVLPPTSVLQRLFRLLGVNQGKRLLESHPRLVELLTADVS